MDAELLGYIDKPAAHCSVGRGNDRRLCILPVTSNYQSNNQEEQKNRQANCPPVPCTANTEKKAPMPIFNAGNQSHKPEFI
jgi:hypothetical protein